MEVLLRGHGGDGGATAGARRLWRCYCDHCTVPRRSWRCRGDPTADWPNPRWHFGSFEHVKSFRRATAKVSGFDSFRRCYCDQWRNHCGTTAIMAAPLRFMSYKHRSGTALSVRRGNKLRNKLVFCFLRCVHTFVVWLVTDLLQLHHPSLDRVSLAV